LEECYKISDVERAGEHITKAEVKRDENKNGFRLPTEKEWELCAKAGTNNKYSGTNARNKIDQYAWYQRNSVWKTHPVGTKKPNEWGLYDMSGNVWEWCWDLYNPENNILKRVVRGGSCRDLADDCRVANRSGYDADSRSFNLGFRLCRSLG
jgi:formylglycine-generating enzyme required for sulfatase activity